MRSQFLVQRPSNVRPDLVGVETVDPIAQSIVKVIDEAVVADALGGDQPAELRDVDILDRGQVDAEFVVRAHHQIELLAVALTWRLSRAFGGYTAEYRPTRERKRSTGPTERELVRRWC